MTRPSHLAALFLLGFAGAAYGEPKAKNATPPSSPAAAPSDPARKAEANRHFMAGMTLVNDGSPNAALAEFEAAFAIVPSARALYAIGFAQKELFHYPEAIAALEKYLAEGATEPVARRREAEGWIAEMRSQIVNVTLSEMPGGASVVVDGRPAGSTPMGPLPLVLGHHVLEVTAEGFQPLRREISVVLGMTAPVRMPLVEVPKNASVRIDCNVAGAAVRIEGKEAGETPLLITLLGGGHSLEVSAPGYLPYRNEITVTPKRDRRIEIKLERAVAKAAPIHRKWWLWTALGAVVVGGAAAVAVGVPLSQGTDYPEKGTLGLGIQKVPASN